MKYTMGVTFSYIISVIFIVPICFSTVLSCKHATNKSELKAISETADNFVEHYFNFDLIATRNLCTKESTKWLSFLASNITQEDINILKEQDKAATYVTLSVKNTSDTTAIAIYKVMDFLMIDTLGHPGVITDEAFYKVNLVKRDGRWLVKMEGLPRSEKQSHD